MSKLSETVKQMQEVDIKKNINFWFDDEDKRQEFLAELFKKLSNLEFISLKASNCFYIEISSFMHFEGTLVVKLSRLKTSHIEIGLFPNDHREQYCLDSMYTIEFLVNYITFKLEDLQYYCEKKSIAYAASKLKTYQKESESDSEPEPESKPGTDYASQLSNTILKSLNKILETYTSEI